MKTHFGDPCIHCNLSHDDVPVGVCTGDFSKAIPVAWDSLGVRWDNVEHFRILMSDGTKVDHFAHISMNPVYGDGYLRHVRYHKGLKP